tara:strand:+ start:2469 stop:3749 length:1281 start_codon:yes stop_codon:yes gene_type:complete
MDPITSDVELHTANDNDYDDNDDDDDDDDSAIRVTSMLQEQRRKSRRYMRRLKMQNESLEMGIKHLQLKADVTGVQIKSRQTKSKRSAEDGEEVSPTLENTKLYDAVCDGNLENVLRLVKRFKRNMNRSTTKDGLNLLHLAVQNDQYDIVEVLLRNGADPNQISFNNSSMKAIHIAAAYGFNDIIDLLIQFGADINAQLPDGYTPLHLAVEFSKIESITALLDLGAKVNIRTLKTTKTPLDNAIDMGNKLVIDSLSNVCQSCGSKENLFSCCCGQVKYCSKRCQKNELNFHHNSCYLYSMESRHLRFKVGDFVTCTMVNDRKVYGTVVRQWYKVTSIDNNCGEEDYYVPYRVKIENDEEEQNTFIYVPEDDDECIQVPECESLQMKKQRQINPFLAYAYASKVFEAKIRRKTRHLEHWVQTKKSIE